MEYVKSVETRNFRLTFQSSDPLRSEQNPPDKKIPVMATLFGNSEDGLRFCDSKDAMAMVNKEKLTGVWPIIRAYELTLPVAKTLGYLDAPATDAKVAQRQMDVLPSPLPSPAPSYREDPFSAANVAGRAVTSPASGSRPAAAHRPASLTVPAYSPRPADAPISPSRPVSANSAIAPGTAK